MKKAEEGESVLVLALWNKLWLTTYKSLIQQIGSGLDTVPLILSNSANSSSQARKFHFWVYLNIVSLCMVTKSYTFENFYYPKNHYIKFFKFYRN